MTFICEGYSKKISDPMEQHTEKPDKKMTVRVAGPGNYNHCQNECVMESLITVFVHSCVAFQVKLCMPLIE